MLPEAYITHSTAERLRIKIPSQKRNAHYFSSLFDFFGKIEGVESVNVNPVTASVLIKHKLTIDAILESAQSNSLFLIRKELPRRTALHKIFTDSFKSLDNRIRKTTKGAVDAGGLAFLMLAGIGIYQISRGNFTAPAWYTAFWYAMNIFLKSEAGNHDETET